MHQMVFTFQLQSPEAMNPNMLLAGFLTYSPRPCLPIPLLNVHGTVTEMGFGCRSLQLRDSPGISPDSLLIFPMTKEPNAGQRYYITACVRTKPNNVAAVRLPSNVRWAIYLN